MSGVDELTTGDPVELARENARRKAEAVAAKLGGDEPVLGVDTDVFLDAPPAEGGRRLFGKPRDMRHAGEMLLALSGRAHTVVSGLALVRDGVTTLADASTEVVFRDVQPILQWYVATGEWEGRAGGYAIQGRGAALVRSIRGDYLNVVGLPVAALLDLAPGLLSTGQ